MNFKVDENLPAECAALLREAGFDADTVGDENLSGADDPTIFERCQVEGRVLITLDLDFSNVFAYPPASHLGVIVLRTRSQDKVVVLASLHRLIPVLKANMPSGQLWIVERDRIRVRQ
ncbi:MAG: DUF5615 family PIN-like protein [Bryobacteraceae bacterium]